MTGTGTEATKPLERLRKPAARDKEPTRCDICGKPLGSWFSLDNKAYCSTCFHSHFWTPFQSVPSKAR